MATKLNQSQFKRIEVAARLAALKGAKFQADTKEKRLRRMAEAVVLPERFNAHYLPHYFRVGAAPFHVALYVALEAFKRIVVRAPRGHAKSTVVTFAYVLHQVVCAAILRAWHDGTLATSNAALDAEIRAVMAEELLARRLTVEARLARGEAKPEELIAALEAEASGLIQLHWDPYVQVVSVTADTAMEFTAAIKAELLDNDLLRSDWGELMADARQSDGDWVSSTDVRVKAFGMMTAIRGGKHGPWRPTLAVLDDPDSEETVGTTRLRDKQTRKITAAINYGLEPKRGRVMMLGTPVHADCQVCRFTAPGGRYKRWHKLRFAAIQADGTPLWPARWTLDALREEEEEDPDAFAMEMMDLPPSSGQPFDELHYYNRADFAGLDLPCVLGFDPALGRTEDADFQALVAIRGPVPAGFRLPDGTDASGWYLVHRVEALRIGDPVALLCKVHAIHDEEQPDVAVIETIGFQSLLLTLSALTRAGQELVAWTPIPSQSTAKDLRIRGMAPLVNRGIIRFPADRSCRVAENQARDYPVGKRDVLDVMEMVVRQSRRTRIRASAADVTHVRRPSRVEPTAPARRDPFAVSAARPARVSRTGGWR